MTDKAQLMAEREIADGIFDTYDYLVRKALKAGWFHDDTAIQSATASMFINLNQTKNSALAYVNKLKQRLAELDESAVIDTWHWNITDRVKGVVELDDSESIRVKAYIKAKIVSGVSNEEIKDSTLDYIRRLTDHRLTDTQRDILGATCTPAGEQLNVKPDSMPESDNDDGEHPSLEDIC